MTAKHVVNGQLEHIEAVLAELKKQFGIKEFWIEKFDLGYVVTIQDSKLNITTIYVGFTNTAYLWHEFMLDPKNLMGSLATLAEQMEIAGFGEIYYDLSVEQGNWMKVNSVPNWKVQLA